MLRRIIADFAYFFSLVGIWPRFIEPKLIKTTKLASPFKFPFSLVQITDLHLSAAQSDRFLKKIIQKVHALKPDIIVFTGDFICRSKLHDKERLKKFLNSFSAPFGCFAILGNHDYEQWITVNRQGEYDLYDGRYFEIAKAFRRLFFQKKLTKRKTERVKKVALHQELMEIIADSPFELLHNKTVQVSIRGNTLNICGIGEFMSGHFKPEEAFAAYNSAYPGIILAHHPDSVPHLLNYPGDLILCGHTHGGQLNLPLLWKKFTLLENPRYKRGLLHEKGKTIYINRGLGSIAPFRFNSLPEILHLTP